MAEGATKLRKRVDGVPDGGQQKRPETVPVTKMYVGVEVDEHGEEYASKQGMMFMETSALEGHNIDKAFALMIAGRDSLRQVRWLGRRDREAAETVGGQTEEQREEGSAADNEGAQRRGEEEEVLRERLTTDSWPALNIVADAVTIKVSLALSRCVGCASC